jgi:hypothetical protein
MWNMGITLALCSSALALSKFTQNVKYNTNIAYNIQQAYLREHIFMEAVTTFTHQVTLIQILFKLISIHIYIYKYT